MVVHHAEIQKTGGARVRTHRSQAALPLCQCWECCACRGRSLLTKHDTAGTATSMQASQLQTEPETASYLKHWETNWETSTWQSACHAVLGLLPAPALQKGAGPALHMAAAGPGRDCDGVRMTWHHCPGACAGRGIDSLKNNTCRDLGAQ